MKETLVSKSCETFGQLLASRAPVPGGGGAAALVGALGTALCTMAGDLTVGRKKFAAVEMEVRDLLSKCQVCQAQLMALVDEDAAIFEPLSRAYSIPKDDPTHDQVLEDATLAACQPPMNIMKVCCQAIDLLETMGELCSPTLISDVGCGAHFCLAALESASLNVFVNTRCLNDKEHAAALEAETDAILETYTRKAVHICTVVLSRLRNKQ